MKQRMAVGLGLGLGRTWGSRDEFASLVRTTEDTGWDSLWFSDHLTSATPAQFPQIAFAAALTSRLRLGTSITVVPGRSPVDLAKNLATLNSLAGGRLLPILGLGIAEPSEHAAFGVTRESRGTRLEQSLPLIRSLTEGRTVEHRSAEFAFPGVGIGLTDPVPIVSFWMGGRSPGELARVGRLADGWLASFAAPAETAAGVELVNRAARRAKRSVDDDHFGLLFPYAQERHSATVTRLLDEFHPGCDRATMAPVGVDQLARTFREHSASGITKFVLVPSEIHPGWYRELGALREDVELALKDQRGRIYATSDH